VNHAEPAVEAAPARSAQRGRVQSTSVSLSPARSDASHSGGLVDDDDVAVEVRDRALGQGAGTELSRAFVDDTTAREERARPSLGTAPFTLRALRCTGARARPRRARLLAHDRRDVARPVGLRAVERFDLGRWTPVVCFRSRAFQGPSNRPDRRGDVVGRGSMYSV